MIRKQFIQFYSLDKASPKWTWKEGDGFFFDERPQLLLGNGFSHVHNEAKPIWLRYDIGGTLEDIIEKNIGLDIPDKNVDEIYVSAFYVTNMYQAYIWAKKYPQIKFIVGGPAVRFNSSPLHNNLLPNLIFLDDLAENLFGNPSGYWDVEMPADVWSDITVLSYAVNNKCYWNKCIFCGYNYDKKLICNKWDTSFLNRVPLLEKAITITHFNIPSCPPVIFNQFPEMSETGDTRLRYNIFIRADKAVIKKMREILPKLKHPEKFYFFVGLEFPSDKMLRYMNKGVTLEQYLELTHLIGSYGIKVRSTVMMGWDCLTEQDYDEASAFIPQMNPNTILSIRPLMALNGSKIYDGEYFVSKKRRESWVGPFYIGYVPEISDEQKELNSRIVKLFFKYPKYRIIDTWSDVGYWNSAAF